MTDTSGSAMEGTTAATNTITANNSNMTTSYLQSRLSTLKSQSQNLSNELTKRLATSRSGQSLLNIGPSLSTLPPDLSSLLEAISPLLHEVEMYEKVNCKELNKLVNQGREVQTTIRKRTFALECAEIYRDLVLGEDIVRWDNEWRSGSRSGSGSRNAKSSPKEKMRSKKEQKQFDYWSDDDEDDDEFDNEANEEAKELDHASSLERVAYTALHLLQELQSSAEEVAAIAMMGSTFITTTNANSATPTTTTDASSNTTLQLPSLRDDDNYYSSSASGINSAIIEKSKYLMKLSPRIRRLESDAVKCLVGRLEDALIAMRSLREEEDGDEGREDDGEFRLDDNVPIGNSLVHVTNVL